MIINLVKNKVHTLLVIIRVKLLDYINFAFDLFNWSILLPEIDELIYVDPSKINKAVPQPLTKGYLKNLHIFDRTVKTRYPIGTSIGGDWDLNLHNIFTKKSGERIKLLIDIYSSKNLIEKKKHEDRLIKFLLKHNQGYTFEEAIDEIKRSDKIYNAIVKNGFQDYYYQKYNLFFFKFRLKAKSGIRVSISRDGEIIWVGSHHRMAIARVLNYKKVPALVYYRHPIWQKERKNFVKKLKISSKNMQDKNLHPDLIKLFTKYAK